MGKNRTKIERKHTGGMHVSQKLKIKIEKEKKKENGIAQENCTGETERMQCESLVMLRCRSVAKTHVNLISHS